MGGKDNLDFPQFVTAIARIAEEIVLKESLVATMSERLHYLCTHLETIVESKKNWRKLQKFTQRLGMVNSLIGGVSRTGLNADIDVINDIHYNRTVIYRGQGRDETIRVGSIVRTFVC